jgi:hypothetical protein
LPDASSLPVSDSGPLLQALSFLYFSGVGTVHQLPCVRAARTVAATFAGARTRTERSATVRIRAKQADAPERHALRRAAPCTVSVRPP